ncbi:Hsp70 family protein, partial [Mycobacterium rufum]|nr:Hsp70 family protein [Mycolicibacterium rufum]
MSDALGLSIGTTNLAAAGVGRPPILRRSLLTIFGHAAPEVGAPAGRAGGVVLSGFVDRVGDPVPLVAADGSRYPAEQLVVDALEAMAGLAGAPSPDDVAIAVPSHWGAGPLNALREAFTAGGPLAPAGSPPRLIPDAVAALTAINADPGLPRGGVVAVVDVGGSGTGVTLADAGSAFDLIGPTERFAEFAGDQIDQTLLTHVLERIPGNPADTAATAAVGSLARLREACRTAKETLSAHPEARVEVEMPGYRGDIVVTRAELEDLIARPLDGLVGVFQTALARNNIGAASVSTIVVVGGGAAIPAVARRFSEFVGRVLVTQRPALDAAVGAALFAAYGRSADTATWIAPAVPPAPPRDDSTYALAWSQDDLSGEDVVPYSGPEIETETETEVVNPYRLPTAPGAGAEEDVKPWQRLPLSVLGLIAAIALIAVGGVAIALTSVDSPDPDQPRPGTAPLSRELAPSSVEGQTVTVSQQPNVPPPATTSAAPPPAPVVTTTVPTTTTQPTTTTTTATTTTTTD